MKITEDLLKFLFVSVSSNTESLKHRQNRDSKNNKKEKKKETPFPTAQTMRIYSLDSAYFIIFLITSSFGGGVEAHPFQWGKVISSYTAEENSKASELQRRGLLEIFKIKKSAEATAEANGHSVTISKTAPTPNSLEAFNDFNSHYYKISPEPVELYEIGNDIADDLEPPQKNTSDNESDFGHAVKDNESSNLVHDNKSFEQSVDKANEDKTIYNHITDLFDKEGQGPVEASKQPPNESEETYRKGYLDALRDYGIEESIEFRKSKTKNLDLTMQHPKDPQVKINYNKPKIPPALITNDNKFQNEESNEVIVDEASSLNKKVHLDDPKEDLAYEQSKQSTSTSLNDEESNEHNVQDNPDQSPDDEVIDIYSIGLGASNNDKTKIESVKLTVSNDDNISANGTKISRKFRKDYFIYAVIAILFSI